MPNIWQGSKEGTSIETLAIFPRYIISCRVLLGRRDRQIDSWSGIMRIIVLLAAILSLAASSALAQSDSTTATPSTAPAEPRVELAAFPQPGKSDYAVIRDGSRIGSQIVELTTAISCWF
jgi:hypothetical protein